MSGAVLLIGIFAACYVGFALLALSQHRHWHHAGGGRYCPRRTAVLLRIAGYALLFVALVLCLERDGASFGSVLWATAITVGACLVVATLSWRVHWLRPLSRFLQHIG